MLYQVGIYKPSLLDQFHIPLRYHLVRQDLTGTMPIGNNFIWRGSTTISVIRPLSRQDILDIAAKTSITTGPDMPAVVTEIPWQSTEEP